MSKSEAKYGSMGTTVKNVEVRVVDSQMRSVQPGRSGEIIVRSPQNMVRYWKNPEETRKTILEDSWLRTGDLAYIDTDGFLWFTARKKQIIIRAGENISPLEVEEVLHAHPAVKHAAVVGISDKFEGEVPRAFVELKLGNTASPAELMEFLAQRLIYYKVPTDIVILREMPVGRTGKIDRRTLLQQVMKNSNV
jgi:long-chain acyl-CoA synthetase